MNHASSNRTEYYELLAPGLWRAPVIFNSPHSGRDYPEALLRMTKLSIKSLRKSEDCFIDEIFSSCVPAGAPLLKALVPRAYIDLNREPYEFDPRLFRESLPASMNTTSHRVAAGLGTIPRVVAEGEEIYAEPLSLADAQARVEHVYKPYHRALQALVDRARSKTGLALLIDCHSMPASALRNMGKAVLADIVLGDRFGRSCPKEITDFVEALFRGEGFSVVRNTPYAGGFITQHHGVPSRNSYALQIEINRSLYLDTHNYRKTNGFEPLQAAIGSIVKAIVAAVEELGDLNRSAAE